MREAINIFQPHARDCADSARGLRVAVMSESQPAPPFVRIGSERLSSPVILSVPHAGRDYSPELLKAARLAKPLLETLEDRLVDRLVWQATAAGATTFVARAPRARSTSTATSGRSTRPGRAAFAAGSMHRRRRARGAASA